jgi:hypothetical protein
MTEDEQILQCCDEPAAAKPRPAVEWWDAADRYFMSGLKGHAIALPGDVPELPDTHLVTKLSDQKRP